LAGIKRSEAHITLYKYLEPARVDVLHHKKLRYSQINALNDPFEGKPYYDRLAPNPVFHSIFGDGTGEAEQEGLELGFNLIQNLFDRMEELVPEEHKGEIRDLRALMPEKDKYIDKIREEYPAYIENTLIPHSLSMMPEIRSQIIEHFNQHIGILCLSETPNSNLMWAHYARNSQGFVLGFDDRNAYFNRFGGGESRIAALCPVTYSRKRPKVRDMLQLTMQELVFTKPLDWEYEKEWRIIRELSGSTIALRKDGSPQLDELNEVVHLFPFPIAALESVIIGSRMSRAISESIIDLMRSPEYKHVTLFQAKESERYYQLEIHPVDLSFVR
jgi:hypothetical protein